MVRPWEYDGEDFDGPHYGRLQVVVDGRDVTFFRDGVTEVLGWSSGDPFDDASAQIRFPQVTPYDDIGAGTLDWLYDGADVDIYRVPPTGSKSKVWEGFIASLDFMLDDQRGFVTATCLGALYQADLYTAKPLFLVDPARHEDLIREQFPPRGNLPNMRVSFPPSNVQFPAGWTTKAGTRNVTGHTTRYSGAWDSVLTGFIQDLLALMQTEDGRQWTLMKKNGRQAVLRIRDVATVDWTIDLGAPGIGCQITRDITQSLNVLYGEGTDEAGTKWRNAVISANGKRTTYNPLGADRLVHGGVAGVTQSPRPDLLDPDALRVESFYNFGSGVGLDNAIEQAARIVQRERDPGYFGSITLKSDPYEGTRFAMKAGQNILVRHFRGTQDAGMLFHIASCEVDFETGEVTLKVDTKARDLLTLDEIEARNRDPKTPSRLLRVNRKSLQFEDTKSPWDYEAGSGYIPIGSKRLPVKEFPYDRNFFETNPHSTGGVRFEEDGDRGAYVYVDGSNADATQRWSIIPVLATERGTIRLIELQAYDEEGARLAVPFHVSVYRYEVFPDEMPLDPATGDRTPFFEGAFDPAHDPENPDIAGPLDALIVGWGDGDQKAGYWPGLESEGDPVTGAFRDEGTWSFELDRGENSLWVAIYCESDAWFQGRMFKGLEE